ncbi:MAG: type VI secretion system baseplate subunit TssE [Alphaproteobacteria bacterium]|nr:type VI secretion system baseplate subunit TssE [Alphaproteobacteria bacterium]
MQNVFVMPLFEKLTDENTEIPFEKAPKTLLSLEELQNSIIEDVTRLLNTRISAFWRNFEQKNQMNTPFSYGVDISAALSTENTTEMRELEARIEKALKTFEPRLIDPKVYVKAIGNNPGSLFINIDASIIMENRRISMSFPVILSS